eukprot:scaffold1821_cov344-Pavlova_lutheri.AAC.6
MTTTEEKTGGDKGIARGAGSGPGSVRARSEGDSGLACLFTTRTRCGWIPWTYFALWFDGPIGAMAHLLSLSLPASCLGLSNRLTSTKSAWTLPFMAGGTFMTCV